VFLPEPVAEGAIAIPIIELRAALKSSKKSEKNGVPASCLSCHLEAPRDRLFGPRVPAE
jgi:hypothetical protein